MNTPLEKVNVLYRLSDAGYNKEKLPEATKKACLMNAVEVLGAENISLFTNKCLPDTLDMADKTGCPMYEIEGGSSAKSWREVAEYALNNLSDQEIVYFLEDDYLHLPGSLNAIMEGLAIADYVTLYDHPDKYIDPAKGGNPFVKEGGEITRVLRSPSFHWKHTNSTTMTFACRLATLKADWKVWQHYTRGSHPNDFKIFKLLTGKTLIHTKAIMHPKRKLISPIPGLSTHVETKFLSPGTNWASVAQRGS